MPSIYALLCPTTHEVKYVGVSDSPTKRFTCHCSNTVTANTDFQDWVVSLRPHKPELIIVEESDDRWEDEQFWIAYLKSLGAKLLNKSKGGKGSLGVIQTDSSKRKNSVAHGVLTEDDVANIRSEWVSNSRITRRQLADKYGVNYFTIADIISDRKWKHLPSVKGLVKKRAKPEKTCEPLPKSGVAGISWARRVNKWQVSSPRINGRRVFIGRFEVLEDAINALANYKNTTGEPL